MHEQSAPDPDEDLSARLPTIKLPKPNARSRSVGEEEEALMARIKGVEPCQAGWFTRLLYWAVRRKMGKLVGKNSLIEPIQITAHHPRLLWAYGQMEMGQEAAHSVPTMLKHLAEVKTALLIGCPF